MHYYALDAGDRYEEWIRAIVVSAEPIDIAAKLREAATWLNENRSTSASLPDDVLFAALEAAGLSPVDYEKVMVHFNCGPGNVWTARVWE